MSRALDPILNNLGPPGKCPPCFSKQTDELKQNPFHDRVIVSLPFTEPNEYYCKKEDVKEHSVSLVFESHDIDVFIPHSIFISVGNEVSWCAALLWFCDEKWIVILVLISKSKGNLAK